MIYFADLHIHSRFSRATSKDCNFIELSRWAVRKGLLVLATGDFTHPQWSREIAEMLEETEDGLYRLKAEHAPEVESIPGGFGVMDVRFILNVEISSIYKKNGFTRKVHNLVFMPDIESIERFNARLDRIGNIKSDGRPILGLDSRDLLEIALESSDDSFLIPAHVWTPWFSILGSKSGFDSVEECFDDLSDHIFALETGLSSDPEMNHRVAALDRYTLISNSDTHSPANLGREANIFFGKPGYKAIREAIRRGGEELIIQEPAASPMESVEIPESWIISNGNSSEFVGTIEFFPEEGKYHLDGHRKCSVRLEPEETDDVEGICPVCGHKVTVGVMNRVVQLGDRPAGEKPDRSAPFWRMLTLSEVVAQSLGVGPQSKKVKALYMDMVGKLGPELNILWALPLEEIASKAPKIIVEGISRVRKGNVSILAGYDGEYGKVQLFTDDERDRLLGQESFLPMRKSPGRVKRKPKSTKIKKQKPDSKQKEDSTGEPEIHLNAEQAEVVHAKNGPIVVQAGPGTGKTRTLIERIFNVVSSGRAKGAEITAVTFTRKAAREIRERLSSHKHCKGLEDVWVGTFHQLGTRILEHFVNLGIFQRSDRTLDEEEAIALFRKAVKQKGLTVRPQSALSIFNKVSLLKQSLTSPEKVVEDDQLRTAYIAYQNMLTANGALDLDDLLCKPVQLLREHPTEAEAFVYDGCRHLLVDEFQDVNKAQYELVKLLSGSHGEGLFVIGDPNQAIYGFRGSDWRFFQRLDIDFMQTQKVQLRRNYRSQEKILQGAKLMIESHGSSCILEAETVPTSPIHVVDLPNAGLEGTFITRTIDSMLGGSSFFSMDSRGVQSEYKGVGFKDFAVLYRLNAVGDTIEKAFMESGIPYQRSRRSNPKNESEELDSRAEVVTLMTIHAAKGLEFPVVFVAGCEDDIIPGNQDESVDMDEECRLLYVAMTRAGQELFMTRAHRRVLFGQSQKSPLTRFLDVSVEPSVFEYFTPLDGHQKPRESIPVQHNLFQ